MQCYSKQFTRLNDAFVNKIPSYNALEGGYFLTAKSLIHLLVCTDDLAIRKYTPQVTNITQ